MKDSKDVPDLMLERYRLGELPAAEAAALAEAIAADDALRERLSALERSDAELLATYPPGEFAAAVARRAAAGGATEAKAPPRGPRHWMLAPASVLAAGLLALAGGGLLLRGVVPGPHASPGEAPPRDRLKGGGPDLLLYRKGGESRIERLEPGAVAHSLDVVQIAYRAGGRRYGVILSVDGRGAVTRHLPAVGEQAAPLRPGGTVALEDAYRLDDAPRLERFYLVAADEPFALEPVLVLAGSTGFDPLTADRLPLGAPFGQASFLLRKE
jgi:hypothetical protein